MPTSTIGTKLDKLSIWIVKKSWSHGLLLVFLAITLSYTLFVFPYFKELYDLLDHGILDSQFGFAPDYAKAVFTAYGGYGRKGIIVFTGIVDAIYPFLYGSTLALLLSRVKVKIKFRNHLWQKINLVPFVAVLFDFIENTGILIMAHHYPAISESVAWITSIAGMIKWIILSGCVLVLLVFFIKTVYPVLAEKRKADNK